MAQKPKKKQPAKSAADDKQPEAVVEATPIEQLPHVEVVREDDIETEPAFLGKKHTVSWRRRLVRRKRVVIPAVIVFVLAVFTAIPATRYVLPGLFVKKSVSFIVVDGTAHTRIPHATVYIDGQILESDDAGLVSATGIHPGTRTVKISKLFYHDYNGKVFVSLFKNKQHTLGIDPTGKPAKVTVKNRLSGRVMSDVTVKTEQGSQGKTGADGTVLLILPSDKTEVKGTISGDKIAPQDITIRAAQDALTNVVQATPAGKIYFLSKASGKIDVVKTNLDGTDRQTVVAGTGQEDDFDTLLMASKDWKYLAFKARRDGTKPKLYLISTTDDTLTVIDEGDASFSPNGWIGSTLVYTVYRNGYNSWQPKATALKSFDAKTRKLTVIDETRAEGTSYYDYVTENLLNVYLFKNQIFYTKSWYGSYYYGTRFAGKNMVFAVASVDGSGKKEIKQWPAGYNASLSSMYAEPEHVYFYVILDGVQTSFWEYLNGSVKQTTAIDTYSFNKPSPLYLESPNGGSTFWMENRDGKNALFVGDDVGKNSKQIATLTEFVPYGWYSDDYVLVSKNSSELYIMGRDGIKPGDVPTKVSDYHKAVYTFNGFGGGYGGGY